ncbi:hypothetical protein SAMN02745975_00522 [Geosporobacter subterraneus DSM 17957]|uniref:Uncharacterized protein n=1 Tax=Geosporobacter subterraneus DSM 17957 TaxID=1121919 RepID=A0A1M6DNZ2_9FIRM|nr:hypothetical protein [Geosporobacter subterraneus]SHI74920.1 hypothetical protein SAMN02745975_00522 [Geosporobacter subterraneus DSM 17957]
MAEKSFPFDAVEIEGIPDRVFFAEDFARYFRQFVGNGVYPNPSSNLQVQTLNNNMVLTVKKGAAFINGYTYVNTEDFEIAINTANGSYNRKDIIVVQLDLVNREILVKYKTGVASANPLAPALVRTSDTYELQLAEILVRSGTQVILDTDITDTRLNASKCGIVAGLVVQIDTTTIFNSYMQALADAQADIAEFKEEWITGTIQQWQNWFASTGLEWETWFTNTKAQIFDAVYFDFDNWRYRAGQTRGTVFNPDGSITETISSTVGGALVASKVTVFNANGSITETLYHAEENVTVTKTTVFNPDGTISEVIV